MDNLVCPECAEQGIAYQAKNPAGLGGHRKGAHGVQGQSRSILDARRRQNGKRKSQRPAKVNLYVQWLADNPGTHNITEIAVALGAEATRVGKNLSASKARGQSVINDGHGNWHYTGEAKTERLPVKAPDPKPTNGQVHFVSQQIVLLLTDSEGREWVASPR